jgi:hypothetical protein
VSVQQNNEKTTHFATNLEAQGMRLTARQGVGRVTGDGAEDGGDDVAWSTDEGVALE